MAEYGEWTRKGATLTDATASAEYGVDRALIIKGIRSGRLEYRESEMWGNPCFRLLRSQIEKYIADELGADHVRRMKDQTELRAIKKEMTSLKKRLLELEARKAAIEKKK